MPQEIARQWFVPGEGIERQVISADIQRYLGNDATVRPGLGTGEHQGVPGFWIKAYRNLTSAMITDLQADSARYRQEQRQASARGSQSPVIYEPIEASGVETSVYGLSQPPPRPSGPDRPLDLAGPPAGRPHHNGNYSTENWQYPAGDRGHYADPRPGNGPGPNGAPYVQGAVRGSIPVPQPYPPDHHRHHPSYASPDDGVPPGYVRQGGYYVPSSSSVEPFPISRPDYASPPPHAGAFGQPQFGGREPRDGRFPPPLPVSDYPDARYAYPSPPVTVSTVSHRDRDNVTGSPQPSYSPAPAQQPAGYVRPYDNRQKYR